MLFRRLIIVPAEGDRGAEEMTREEMQAEAAGEGSDMGAPVAYFVYPHPM
jgi:hypothetical protein